MRGAAWMDEWMNGAGEVDDFSEMDVRMEGGRRGSREEARVKHFDVRIRSRWRVLQVALPARCRGRIAPRSNGCHNKW